MRHSYTLFIYALLAVISLTACKDDFDIDKVKSTPKLILYCMPTVGDTTVIELTRSLPVNTKGSITPVVDAHINYSVNGKTAEVINMGDGSYKAVAHQQVGDRIELTAQADGLSAVSASTTILDAVSIDNPSVRKVHLYSNYNEQAKDFYQISATFTDNVSTKDYYAVRVVSGTITPKGDIIYTPNNWEGNAPSDNIDETDTVESVQQIYLDSEPLLNGIKQIDYDFGYDNNDYKHFYLFTDDGINGKTYTLHLNVAYEYGNELIYLPDGSLYSQMVSSYYRVILYHITPEFYHFIHSIGSLDNNDLAKAGLSNIAPSYGNVKGGIGMAAGYQKAKTKWARYEEIGSEGRYPPLNTHHSSFNIQ